MIGFSLKRSFGPSYDTRQDRSQIPNPTCHQAVMHARIVHMLNRILNSSTSHQLLRALCKRSLQGKFCVTCPTVYTCFSDPGHPNKSPEADSRSGTVLSDHPLVQKPTPGPCSDVSELVYTCNLPPPIVPSATF